MKKNKTHKKQLNKNIVLYCVFILLGLVILLNILTYASIMKNVNVDNNKHEVVAMSELDIFFIVSDQPGFALEDQFLHLGMITPGGSGSKKLTLNSVDKAVFVSIRFSDEIRDYVEVSDNNFVFYPDETKILTFNLYDTDNLTYGNYTGAVGIYYLDLD